jgi:delta14-sterol reductase/lamin-B receptor
MGNAKGPPPPFPYEFGGPLGTLAVTLALPVVVLVLLHWSHEGSLDLSVFSSIPALLRGSSSSNSFQSLWQEWKASPVFCPGCDDPASLIFRCGGAAVGWFAFQVALERWLPAEIVLGAPVQGQKNLRLPYRINGHLAFWVTLLVAQVGWPYYKDVPYHGGAWQLGPAPLSLLHDNAPQLALCTIVLCFALSLYLYLDSFRGQGRRVLAAGGNSGNPVYDFFMGRELNPRICTFDWKEFCELRPGLILWVLLNAGACQKQKEVLGYASGSMILLNVFQGLYVWDALYQERAILTTMDITTDGFGFMLVFGDLAWVPFTYSLQSRYLVHHDPNLGPLALLSIVALYGLGYCVFRGANGQKDAFRRNPDDPTLSYLTYLQTRRGTKLLTSGWWGMARKINYTGDWIMGLTWCLVCGFDSIVPYFYAVYFGVLLVHRSVRDDHQCQQKYGDDWIAYKKLVPCRFVPGVV